MRTFVLNTIHFSYIYKQTGSVDCQCVDRFVKWTRNVKVWSYLEFHQLGCVHCTCYFVQHLEFLYKRFPLESKWPGDQAQSALADIISNSKSARLPKFHKLAHHLPVYEGKTDQNRFLAANVFPSWAANSPIQLTITNFNQSRFKMRFQGNGPTVLMIIHSLARGRVFTWDMKLGVIFQPTSYDFSTKDHN